ncbi:MAG: hypothetical protein ACRYFS_22000 [Janthinobacterium lividum]
MNPYPTYKDSSLPWLGDIPMQWKVIPLKYFLDINDHTLSENTSADYVIEYLDISNVGSTGIIGPTQRFVFKDAPSRARRIVKSGDTVISTVRTYLKAIAHFDNSVDNLVASTGFAVLTPCKGVLPKYISYLVHGYAFINQVTVASKGVNYPAITSVELGSIKIVATTDYAEQAAIVSYLDRKTADIERFISKKKQLITTLNEQKTAIINRAVTKGLNPNVPMKASGVEWLGEVPAHWEITRVKYLFREINRRSAEGEGGRHLSMSQKFGLVDQAKVGDGLAATDNQDGFKKCEVNDLVLNKLKSHLGVFAVANQDGLVSPDYAVYQLKADGEIHYFERLFKTKAYIAEFTKAANGIVIGFMRLYTPDFFNIPCLCPPPLEQKAIMQFINAEVEKVDSIIARIVREIELINEYRTTLISDAVTGKIDVRQAEGMAEILTT